MFRFIKRWLPSGEEIRKPGKFARQSAAMIRREYSGKALDESNIFDHPIDQFDEWFSEAINKVKNDPNAMLLSTADSENQPSSRIVLLKEYDESGFVFYTNYRSRKAQELSQNSKASLTFFWPALMRQIRIEGIAEKVPDEQSEAYFQKRPTSSQLSAWASPQSETVTSRSELEKLFKKMESRFSGKEVPRPPHWGGYLVKPHRMEFWQGRLNRLHDRICYVQDENGGWEIKRLAP